MRAVAYLRVSSKAQDHRTQLDSIRRAAKARGDTLTATYEEKRSGKTLARPELDRLRADVRTGLVRRVYVFKLDRVTRSGVADTYAVVSEFRAAGCELIAVADSLHLKPGTDDLQSDVFVFALGLAAKLERTAINDRIAAARARVEAEGRAWGRPERMDAATKTKARALKARGKSTRAIAVALKVPKSTIARALHPSTSARL